MSELKDDIEKYLSGELTPAEMHALERKALSDPFLADALEGGASLHSEEFTADVSALRGKLPLRRGKTVPMWIWTARIAAGIALIGLVAYVFLRTDDLKNEDRIAKNNGFKADTQDVAKDSIPRISERSPTVDAASENRQTAPQKPNEKQRPKAQPHQEVVEKPNQDLAAAETNQPNDQVILPPSFSMTDTVLREDLPASAGFADGIDTEPSAATIAGRVIDSEEGKGLPGVNVTIKGTSIGTITDEEGRYKIPMDSIGKELQFSFIGYENREMRAGKANEVDVSLNPDISQLSEVVVVGYGGTKREDPEANPVIELAEPAGGRKAFKNYLQQNLKYPEQALNNKVEGRVTIQFTIETSGKLSEFKVLKSLGFGCDEEVIRLIKQGPKWNPSRRNTEPVSDKVKVRMRFALPKK